LRAYSIAHPGNHSDIIGSIWVAMKMFSKKQTNKRLVVLSDFIQDDNQFNFRKDSRLATEADAVVLGKKIVLPEGDSRLPEVVLGRLKSKDFSALTPARQRAVNAFWRQIMAPAEVKPDGTAAVLQASAGK
jgi:hypothetical protein